MRTVGFDMDGVILNCVGYGLIKKTGLDEILLARLIKNRFFQRIFYSLVVRANEDMREILFCLKERGDRIIIISANPGPNGFLEGYLRKKDIPFDALWLWDQKDPELFFKMLTIQREGCNVYIDDRPLIVHFLCTHLHKCQVICFKNQSLPELKKMFQI